MNKLNFGCGSIQPQDWINIDNDPDFHAGRSTKIYEDNHFDIIVAHAVVQQFEWHSLVDNLCELKRVLKKGGVIRISLPDIEAGFEAYKRQDVSWFPNGEDKLPLRFAAWLTWYSTSVTLLTPDALREKLYDAGFMVTAQCAFKETKLAFPTGDAYRHITTLDTRENEFFFIEARK